MQTDYSCYQQWAKYFPPIQEKKEEVKNDLKTLPDDVVRKQVIAPYFHSGKKGKAKL